MESNGNWRMHDFSFLYFYNFINLLFKNFYENIEAENPGKLSIYPKNIQISDQVGRQNIFSYTVKVL